MNREQALKLLRAHVANANMVKKEKSFARSVNREVIKECEKIGIPLSEFVELAVRAMQSVGTELGL